MDLVDLVVPSAAIFSLFAVVALVVVAVLHGRKLRKLEERLARAGDAAEEAPLQRIADLQARHATSSGISSGQMRTVGMVALVAVALVAAVGGVWYLFIRDSGSSSPSGGGATTQSTSTGTTPSAPTPVDATLLPDVVPPLADKSIYTLTVFNATGIAGAAGDVVAPKLRGDGWNVPADTIHIQNEPNGLTGLKKTVVMYATKGKQKVAWNVAKDLGLKNARPFDGYTTDQAGDADVLVVVGLDLANGPGTVTAP